MENESNFICLIEFHAFYNLTIVFGNIFNRFIFTKSFISYSFELKPIEIHFILVTNLSLSLDPEGCMAQPQIYSVSSDLSREGGGLVLNCTIKNFENWAIDEWVLPNKGIAHKVLKVIEKKIKF